MSRAFIVGNGPSLTPEDLELLEGETTFALNRIHLIYPETEWRPTYWVYTDIQDMREDQWIGDCLFHLDQGYHCFIWSNLCTGIELERKTWDYWKPNVTWIPICRKHVSMDIAHPKMPNSWHLPTLCKFGTGAAIAMQLAVLRKHSPIYLIGMDLGFKARGERGNPDPNHFSEKYGVWDMHSKLPVDANRKNATHFHAHKMAKKACDELGIEIFNASRGGKVLDQIYPRVELEKII